jgi:hypothetical protein
LTSTRSSIGPAATAAALAVLLGSAAAATTVRHHTPAGMALARHALLRRGDLGRGWSGLPAPTKVPDMTCPGFSPRLQGVVETGSATTPTFRGSSSGPFVSQTAYAYATAAQQGTVWRKVGQPGLLRCVAASLAQGSSNGVHFTVTDKRLVTLPKFAAQAAGYRVTGTASRPGQTIDVYLDVLVLGRGETVAEISISSFEQPVARSFELRLGRIVARRMGPG